MTLALTTSMKSITPVGKLCSFFAFILILPFSVAALVLVMAYQNCIFAFVYLTGWKLIMLIEIYKKVRSVIEFLLLNVIHLIRHIFIHIIVRTQPWLFVRDPTSMISYFSLSLKLEMAD